MFGSNEREARKPAMKENLKRFCSKGFLHLMPCTPQEVCFSSVVCVFPNGIDSLVSTPSYFS